VERYLASHDVAKLQIGAGDVLVEGWLSSDLVPKHPEVMPLNAARRWPFPDHSLDHVYGEHLIEHLTWAGGQRALAECLRVLKPKGVLRLATPDLARLVAAYLGEAGPDGDHYLRWVQWRHLPNAPHRHPAFMLNHVVRAWGHRFLYDAEVLRIALSDAGFVDVAAREFGESPHEHLRGIERHHAKSGGAPRERAVRFETMVFEATSPG
jgi:predicted SAM-dependent methyltransferase